ncbi:MAG: hypothetical protein IPO35_01030 [Uliginosibacterium sp.]|nr:hypothetical protein [Uliginosibacterium sp.]
MKSLILALALLTACAPVLAAEPDPREAALLAQRLQAEQWRDEAGVIRAEAETVYKREDQACLPRLLVNACRDTARERYLGKIKQARDKEIEANRVDAAAKAELNALRAEKRMPPRPSASAPNGVAPPAAASEPPKLGTGTMPLRGEPPPPPAAQDEAAFEARKRLRLQQAELARKDEASQAKARAAKAKADRDRYDARAKQIAERKAKRAEKAAAAEN